MAAQSVLTQNIDTNKLKFAGRARFRVLAYRLVTSKQSAAKRRGWIVDSPDKLKFNGIFGGAETLLGSL